MLWAVVLRREGATQKCSFFSWIQESWYRSDSVELQDCLFVYVEIIRNSINHCHDRSDETNWSKFTSSSWWFTINSPELWAQLDHWTGPCHLGSPTCPNNWRESCKCYQGLVLTPNNKIFNKVLIKIFVPVCRSSDDLRTGKESSVPMTSPTHCRHVTTFYPVTTLRSTWNIFTSFNTKKWQIFFILWLWKRFKSFYCFYKFPIILATLPVLDMIWLWSFYQPSTILTRFYDVSFWRDIRRVESGYVLKLLKSLLMRIWCMQSDILMNLHNVKCEGSRAGLFAPSYTAGLSSDLIRIIGMTRSPSLRNSDLINVFNSNHSYPISF